MTPGSASPRRRRRARRAGARRAASAPPPGQAHDDAGLAEERRLLREKPPRLLGGQLDAGRVPLLEAPARRRRESDAAAAEAREERVLRGSRTAARGAARPSRATPRSPRPSRAISSFSVDSRAYARANEPPTVSGGTTRIPRRSEPLGQRVEDAGGSTPRGAPRTPRRPRRAAGVSARPATAERLGTVARAAPLGGKDVAQDVARGRVHGGVEEALQDGRGGREAALGSPGGGAGLGERARHGRERGGEAAEALLLVRVRRGPAASAGGRRRPSARRGAGGGGRTSSARPRPSTRGRRRP